VLRDIAERPHTEAARAAAVVSIVHRWLERAIIASRALSGVHDQSLE
jgi:hypothetical protein